MRFKIESSSSTIVKTYKNFHRIIENAADARSVKRRRVIDDRTFSLPTDMHDFNEFAFFS